MRADGRFCHHVAEPEGVGGALRGHVELRDEQLVPVGALRELERGDALAAGRLRLEDVGGAVLEADLVDGVGGAAAERLGGDGVGAVERGIGVLVREAVQARLDEGRDGEAPIEGGLERLAREELRGVPRVHDPAHLDEVLRLGLDGPERAVGELQRVERLRGRCQVGLQRLAELPHEPQRAAVLLLHGKLLDQRPQLRDRERGQVVVLRGGAVREALQLVGDLARVPRQGRGELVHLPPVRVGRVRDELEGELPEPPLGPDHLAERGEEHPQERGELRLQERDVGRREGRDGEVGQRLERHAALDVREARPARLDLVAGRAEELGVERRALRGVVALRLRERVLRLVELAADVHRLAGVELALPGRGGEVVDAPSERRERVAEVGRDLLRAVHLERLRGDERGERPVEAGGGPGIVRGLLRQIGELADERFDLRGAAVVEEHRLLERGPHGGGRVARKRVDRLGELLRKLRLRVESGLDRLADGVALVPDEAAALVLRERVGDLAARELSDLPVGLLRGRGGLVDRLAKRLGEPGGRRLERLGVDRLGDRPGRLEEHRVQLGGDAAGLFEPGVRDGRLALPGLGVRRAALAGAGIRLRDLGKLDGKRIVHAARDDAEASVSAHGFSSFRLVV